MKLFEGEQGQIFVGSLTTQVHEVPASFVFEAASLSVTTLSLNNRYPLQRTLPLSQPLQQKVERLSAATHKTDPMIFRTPDRPTAQNLRPAFKCWATLTKSAEAD
ncbi:MAG: hypothetical protein SLRJCFUN_001450 [Candidatus Fervidibacter sp.]